MLSRLAGQAVVVAMRLWTGVRVVRHAAADGLAAAEPQPAVYVVNHTSHGDAALVWSVLTPERRRRCRPVLGADDWSKGRWRRAVGERVMRVLSCAGPAASGAPAEPAWPEGAPALAALAAGESLIVFPEGVRNEGDDALLPFDGRLAVIADHFPQAAWLPVWVDNLARVLPKGKFLPLPLACTVYIGEAVAARDGEAPAGRVERARAALLALRPAGPAD